MSTSTDATKPRPKARRMIDRIHQTLIHQRRVSAIVAGLLPLMPAQGRVLDVGAGDGQLAARVQGQRPALRIEAIDTVARPSTAIPVTLFDGQRIPFEDHSFAAVMLIDVLHHADDPMALLREAVRVSGGSILIKDHLADPPLALPRLRFMDRRGNARHGVSLPYHYWRWSQWAEAAEACGCRITARNTRLALYPPPLSWVFEYGLQVLMQWERQT